MQKNKKMIVACALMAVSAFGLGAIIQTQSVTADETEKEAILYYDFSADTIGENVNGYSSVTNLGTKKGEDATIFNGTGLTVSNGLVFDQPEHATLEEGKQKGYFELPTESFEELTSFTVQMDVCGWDAGGDREPIFAMTQTSLSTTTFGDNNQGLVFGDGWTTTDYTYMESWIGGNNGMTETKQRPFIEGINYLLTFKYDGTNVSFYVNNTLLLQKANADTSFFANYDYFRIGGLMINNAAPFQALKANIDNVKLYDYARTFEQISEDSARVLASRVTEAGNAPVFYFDFETDAVGKNKIVYNYGLGGKTDTIYGQIVAPNEDVYISDGKLVINNPTTPNTTNGYFKLPWHMFTQLAKDDWTLELKVDKLDLHGDAACSFISFSQKDPSQYGIDSSNNTAQIFWGWNGTVMAPAYRAENLDKSEFVSSSNIANLNVNESKTIAIVFKNNILSFVYNNQTVFTTSYEYDPFGSMIFNKIGGYLYSWGRSSADIVIDSLAFYDYARTNDQIASFNGMVENIVANLDSSATSVTSYTAYDRFGNKVEANVTFPETIDFETVGAKTYYVSVANQAAPARFTLNTTAHECVDADNDNECEDCGDIIDGIGKAYGINLSLKGTISANVYMSLTEETIADAGAYMHITYGDKAVDVNVADARKDTSSGETYYVFSIEVPAKDMEKEITSYMIRSNGKTGVTYTYSVKEYAEKLLDDTTGTYDSAKSLMRAMLSYGEYAKAFFTGEALEATADMDAVTQETLSAYAHTVTGTLPEGMNIVGTTLILKSETTIRVYFTVSNAIDNYTFVVDGNSVAAIEVGNVYCVEITNISAKDLDTTYTITVNDSFVITYSAMSYARTAIGSSDVSLKKLAQALYLYNQAADEYFLNN